MNLVLEEFEPTSCFLFSSTA